MISIIFQEYEFTHFSVAKTTLVPNGNKKCWNIYMNIKK